MHTVVSPQSSPPVLVQLIKRIYSKIRNTKKPRPPIEIQQEAPNTRNGELDYLDCWPTREHCIGLCRSLSYHAGREKKLYLRCIAPFDWETITRAILHHRTYSELASKADIDMWKALRYSEMKIGLGRTVITMPIIDGHLMMTIITDLPIDKHFIVHGVSWENLSSHQSRCWHMSQTLESDCDQLIQRMRKPLTYDRINCPDRYYQTHQRRCQWCPSEYIAWIYRTEEEECGDEEEYYPYHIQFRRWIDLGKWAEEGKHGEVKAKGESEEFKALTAGQVCCDHLGRARELPIDCLWQGRDWSTISPIRERAQRRLSIGKKIYKKIYYALDDLLWLLDPRPSGPRVSATKPLSRR
jgi:hypothetical protein